MGAAESLESLLVEVSTVHSSKPSDPTLTSPGGKHFSRDLRPLDADGNEVSMWSENAQRRRGADDDDDESGSGSGSEEEEEESEEEESADEAGPSSKPAPAELSREDRKKEKQARKAAAVARAKQQAVQVGDLPPSDSEEEESDDDDMPANPNHSRQARNQTKAPAGGRSGVDEAADGVAKMSVAPSRREREALEAQQARERYRKLHEAGKTDEAKADLARLKLIREKREAEAARKKVCICPT